MLGLPPHPRGRTRLRAEAGLPLGAGGVLTRPHVYCRILSLACSPNGASFVCSAAAPSLASQVDFSAPDIGSKATNQVPGKLLLWDTKTMKQQVQALPLGVSPWVCVGSCSCGSAVFLMSLILSLLRSPQISVYVLPKRALVSSDFSW